MTEFHVFLRGIGSETMNNRADIDLDPGMLFFLYIFAICIIVFLYCCSVGVSTVIMSTVVTVNVI